MAIKCITILYIHALGFFHCYLEKSGMKRLEIGVKLNDPLKELCYLISFIIKTFIANPNEAIMCYNYH